MTPPTFSTVAIVGRPDLDAHRAFFDELEQFLVTSGKRVLWEATVAATFDKTASTYDAIREQADLVLVFGGDGTFILAARELAGTSAYLLGSKLQGTFGFLTEHDYTQLTTTLAGIFAGQSSCDNRLTLRVSVIRDGQTIQTFTAINEAVVNQSGIARLVTLDLATDRHPITTYLADGLIIATPTGSTAYSLAAGGPIVYPSLDALVITPINPHVLANRPIVIPADFALTATIRDPGTMLTVDGQQTATLEPGDWVRVEKNDWHIHAIHPLDRNYFALLRKKLHWSERSC